MLLAELKKIALLLLGLAASIGLFLFAIQYLLSLMPAPSAGEVATIRAERMQREQEQQKAEEQRKVIDFSKPVYTRRNAEVCPQGILFDPRADRGAEAFWNAERSIWNRKDKFRSLGCEIWSAGLRVHAKPFDPPLDQYVGVSRSPTSIFTLFTNRLHLTN